MTKSDKSLESLCSKENNEKKIQNKRKKTTNKNKTKKTNKRKQKNKQKTLFYLFLSSLSYTTFSFSSRSSFGLWLFLQIYPLSQHLHKSVQLRFALRHWHLLLEHLSFAQPHFTSWITASGAGGKVVITGSHLLSSNFQPKLSGDGSWGRGTMSLFQTIA